MSAEHLDAHLGFRIAGHRLAIGIDRLDRLGWLDRLGLRRVGNRLDRRHRALDGAERLALFARRRFRRLGLLCRLLARRGLLALGDRLSRFRHLLVDDRLGRFDLGRLLGRAVHVGPGAGLQLGALFLLFGRIDVGGLLRLVRRYGLDVAHLLVDRLLHPRLRSRAILAMAVVGRRPLDQLRRDPALTLLHRVRRLVRHKLRVAGVLSGPQPDMIAVGECLGVERARRGVGAGVVMDLDGR